MQERLDRACSGSTRCRLYSATLTMSATMPVVTTSRSGCRQLLRCRWCPFPATKLRRSLAAVRSVTSKRTSSPFTVRLLMCLSARSAGVASGLVTALPWFVLSTIFSLCVRVCMCLSAFVCLLLYVQSWSVFPAKDKQSLKTYKSGFWTTTVLPVSLLLPSINSLA